jgi:DUF3048 family protein
MVAMDSDIRSANKKTPAGKIKPEATEVFRTPEEVAADEQPSIPDNPVKIDPPMPKKSRSSWKEKMTLHWPPGKKEWLSLLVILLLVGGCVAGYMLTHKPKPPTIKPIPKITPQTKTVPSTLTGLPVDPSVNQRTVTGIMVENSVPARPQAGLGQAGVVFEAIAEGGITRFLALYQDTAPDNVGPIRSARPYYAQWVLGFDAGYAHVGGSPEALADIKAWGVRDLDQFHNGDSYHRVSSRPAPHNVYTSIAALNQLEVDKGYITSHFTGFVRKKKEAPHRPVPTAKSIDFAISGPAYNAHYDYDAKSNSYARSEGGAPHMDSNTNAQIKPKVVIAMIMSYGVEADGYHSVYNAIGSGPVYVFQDGGVTTGQWTKSSPAGQITFTDGSGKPIKLNPGQTWLTAVSGADHVSYAP